MPGSVRPLRRTMLATLITLSSGLLLAAASPPSPGDACSLLTKEDAAAVLGEAATGPKSVGPIKDGTGAIVTGCEYTGSGLHNVQLNLTLVPANAIAMYRMICAKAKKDGLAGLGDVACWYKDKHEELHVIKGGAFVSIQLRRGGDPTEPIKALMKKAVGRLK